MRKLGSSVWLLPPRPHSVSGRPLRCAVEGWEGGCGCGVGSDFTACDYGEPGQEPPVGILVASLLSDIAASEPFVIHPAAPLGLRPGGQVGQPAAEQPTGWRSQNQADDDEGQCHRKFVPTALPRCWPAGQSGHAGHGVRWMAGDLCRQRSIQRRRAGGSSNGARYPRSFRPAGCIGPRNGICARSLSCLLVAGPPRVLLLCAKDL